MLATYKATLKGDRLQWQEDNSRPPSSTQPVQVLVTVLEPALASDVKGRGRRMKEALHRLAVRNTLTDIGDAAQWERDIRQDRPLPGRET
ncbi:MAG: hypothetical protein HYX89_01925 [Chloroflexi bacterium]|nr:hypothetical protein [Chloroflexota bacterium]